MSFLAAVFVLFASKRHTEQQARLTRSIEVAQRTLADLRQKQRAINNWESESLDGVHDLAWDAGEALYDCAEQLVDGEVAAALIDAAQSLHEWLPEELPRSSREEYLESAWHLLLTAQGLLRLHLRTPGRVRLRAFVQVDLGRLWSLPPRSPFVAPARDRARVTASGRILPMSLDELGGMYLELSQRQGGRLYRRLRDWREASEGESADAR